MNRILSGLPELAEMNRIIAECLSTPNRMMNDIVTRYLKVKGKQIRPVLVILSAKMAMSPTKCYMPAPPSRCSTMPRLFMTT